MHPGIDAKTRAMIETADRMRSVMTPSIAREVENNIRDRINWVAAGADRAPEWFNSSLREIDPFLRARFRDDLERWVIERWSGIDRCWLQVMVWQARDGSYLCLNSLIFTILRESDMQRFSSPAEYLRHKREKAAKVREANEKAHSDRVLTALDKVNIDQFVDVQNAIGRGEKIIAHGDDEKSLERMHKQHLSQLAAEADSPPEPPAPPKTFSVNPGHRPDIRLAQGDSK